MWVRYQPQEIRRLYRDGAVRFGEGRYGCLLLPLCNPLISVAKRSGRETIMMDGVEIDAGVIQNVRASQYVTVAIFCLLVYDHGSSCILALDISQRTYPLSPLVLTFSDELNFVWQSRSINLVKALFIFNRYVVPVFLIVDTARKLTYWSQVIVR